MPRRPKAKGLYQRGPYWLDWDRRADGGLRSPNLVIFWYDADRGKNRTKSAGTADVAGGKLALDAHYLATTQGATICPTCGQRRHVSERLTVDAAIADYLARNAHRRDALKAIRPRLAHVLDYLESLPTDPACEAIDEAWIARMREWLLERPIVSKTGKRRVRSLSTVENSVMQLAAAINDTHRNGDITRPAQFKPIPIKELNRTPEHRSDIDELIAMFRFATDPKYPEKRGPLHRFLIISVATLARPDAAFDVSVDPKRGQWNTNARVLNLNPKNRRQTKKYRAIVPVAWQVARRLDGASGFFIGTQGARTAWRSMCAELKLPGDGEAGSKLVRRSMAHLLRQRGVPVEQVETMLGHRKIDSVSELYAPFDPNYCVGAKVAIEAIIDEIESAVPNAFHRNVTGAAAVIVPIGAAKRAAK